MRKKITHLLPGAIAAAQALEILFILRFRERQFCDGCGLPFLSWSPTQRYCNEGHAARARNRGRPKARSRPSKGDALSRKQEPLERAELHSRKAGAVAQDDDDSLLLELLEERAAELGISREEHIRSILEDSLGKAVSRLRLPRK
jgi:hypothetical protein